MSRGLTFTGPRRLAIFFRLFALVAALFVMAAHGAFAQPGGESPAGGEPGVAPAWNELEPGLEFGEFTDGDITVLRIDPDRFDFALEMASADGGAARPLGEWAREKDLAAAINASMYLPDGMTSTGYLRGDDHINNPRIAARFGAFFAAGPKREGLPQAMIIDRDMPNFRQLMDDYRLVVQNYRLINAQRRILWQPGGPLYAISAVGQDGAGRILFLHGRTPVEAHAFARKVLELPIDARTVMYVEGGAQAGLVVRTSKLSREITVPHAPSFLATGNLKAPLPNVLGVRKKREAAKNALQN